MKDNNSTMTVKAKEQNLSYFNSSFVLCDQWKALCLKLNREKTARCNFLFGKYKLWFMHEIVY